MDLVPVVLEFVAFVSINTLALKIIWSVYLLSFNPALYFFFYSRITGLLKHTIGIVNNGSVIDLPGTILVHILY